MSSVGVFCRIEKSSVHILTCDLGRTLFWKKNAPTATNDISTMSGAMTLTSEMPLDFMAVSSTCSPRLPKVMSDARRMDNGSANGTIDRAA